MSKSIYIIYKYTSPSGKSYIGQTNNPRRRRSAHKNSNSCCTYFKNAIQKYGIDNFVYEVLIEHLTLDESNMLETKLILEHNTLAPNGYNLTTGGNSPKFSLETALKISQSKIGKPQSDSTKQKISNTLRGRKIPEETLQKRSITRSLKNIKRSSEAIEKTRLSHIGVPKSEEHKQKISNTLKGKCKPPRTEEHRKHQSESRKGRKRFINPETGKISYLPKSI